MACTITPGYMGAASIGGTVVRFTDASISMEQSVNLPELVQGFRLKNAYWAGPITVKGTISGPVYDGMTWSSVNAAPFGNFSTDPCGAQSGTIVIKFNCDDAIECTECFITDWSWSCTAGDVAQWSIGWATGKQPTVGGSVTATSTTLKLLSWDAVTVTGLPELDCLQAIEFSYSAPPIYYQTLADTDKWAHALLGQGQITGSATYYNPGDPADGEFTYAGVGVPVTVTSGPSGSYALHGITANANPSIPTHTIGMTSIG